MSPKTPYAGGSWITLKVGSLPSLQELNAGKGARILLAVHTRRSPFVGLDPLQGVPTGPVSRNLPDVSPLQLQFQRMVIVQLPMGTSGSTALMYSR
jgi:hypothetical protein